MGWLNLCVCGAKTIGYNDQGKSKKSRKRSGKKSDKVRDVIADDIRYEKCESNLKTDSQETKRLPKMGKLGRNDRAIIVGSGNVGQIARPKMGTYNKRLRNDHVPADDIQYENLKFHAKDVPLTSASDDDILRSEKAEGIDVEAHGKLWMSENAVNEVNNVSNEELVVESSDDSLNNSLDSLAEDKGSKEIMEVQIGFYFCSNNFLEKFLNFY